MLRNILCAAVTVLLAGCAASATYPPTAGKTVLPANTPPLPQVMASALRYAQQRGNPNAALVFNLPPDTMKAAWDDVARRLGDGTRPMTAEDKEAFTVRQVRLNGGKAEVDVVYPTPEGVYQIMTVHLEGGFGVEFRPMFVQRWLIPAKAQAFNPPQVPGDGSQIHDSRPGEIEDPVAATPKAEDPAAPKH